jgi:hypothetical protein
VLHEENIMKIKNAVAMVIIIAVFSISLMKPVRADGTPTIRINPASQELPDTIVGQTFGVNITINDVTDLWAWKVRLNWNPQILNITNVQEGPFLQSAGNTLFIWSGLGATTINQGYIREISCNLLVATGASGSGVLATLTFKVLAAGTSDITINETELLSSTDDNPPIQHGDVNGYAIIPYTFSASGQQIKVISNSTITNFQFNPTEKKISFNVSGSDGTKGFSNITIPKDLMGGIITVYKDQLLLTSGVDYVDTSNSTHYVVNIVYSQSSHEIEIVGPQVTPSPSPTPPPSPSPTPSSEPVIPEFPVTLVLPPLMILIAIAIIAFKKLAQHAPQEIIN